MTKPIMPRTPFPADAQGVFNYVNGERTLVFDHPPAECMDWKDWWYFHPHSVPTVLQTVPLYY